jgi:hypothetical protein
MRRRGKLAAALMSSLVLLGGYLSGGVMPHAGADDRQYEEFYTPPDPLPPGQPGDLIRTEPSRLVLEPSGQLGAYVGTGTRIMYRSNDAQGNPVAVTGTYIEPDVPWPSSGPRPLLAYATGPYGAGEQCAPSRLFNQGIHFSQGFDLMINVEEGWIATMLARGFAIVVTDGVGMGIHGPQSPQWLNRVAAGTAMLDAARAAMKLPDTSLDPHGPVAFWGYASGGQASLSAAELASTYAPELNRRHLQTQRAGVHRAQPLGSTHPVSGCSADCPGLVHDGRRRRVLDQRTTAAVQQVGRQQPATARCRREAKHGLGDRPLQRGIDHTELRSVLNASVVLPYNYRRWRVSPTTTTASDRTMRVVAVRL